MRECGYLGGPGEQQGRVHNPGGRQPRAGGRRRWRQRPGKSKQQTGRIENNFIGSNWIIFNFCLKDIIETQEAPEQLRLPWSK